MDEQDEALALGALAWIIADTPRAERLLSLTGLGADELRASLGERATLAAILAFLTAHEADLVACAAALRISPADLAAAAHRLGDSESIDA